MQQSPVPAAAAAAAAAATTAVAFRLLPLMMQAKHRSKTLFHSCTITLLSLQQGWRGGPGSPARLPGQSSGRGAAAAARSSMSEGGRGRGRGWYYKQVRVWKGSNAVVLPDGIASLRAEAPSAIGSMPQCPVPAPVVMCRLPITDVLMHCHLQKYGGGGRGRGGGGGGRYDAGVLFVAGQQLAMRSVVGMAAVGSLCAVRARVLGGQHCVPACWGCQPATLHIGACVQTRAAAGSSRSSSSGMAAAGGTRSSGRLLLPRAAAAAAAMMSRMRALPPHTKVR